MYICIYIYIYIGGRRNTMYGKYDGNALSAFAIGDLVFGTRVCACARMLLAWR